MGSSDLIERYLDELDRGLRPLGRRRRHRVLVEARDHLYEAAAAIGEAEALHRFGAASELVTAHLGQAGTAAPRRSITAFAMAGITYGFIQAVASPATFGLFPPGPWPNDVPPRYLSWKVDLAGALIGLALAFGLAGLALAWTTRQRPLHRRFRAPQLALAGALVFAASWPFETIFLIQRGNAVSGSPSGLVIGSVCATLLACHVAAVSITTRSLRLVRAAVAVAKPT